MTTFVVSIKLFKYAEIALKDEIVILSSLLLPCFKNKGINLDEFFKWNPLASSFYKAFIKFIWF